MHSWHMQDTFIRSLNENDSSITKYTQTMHIHFLNPSSLDMIKSNDALIFFKE